MLYTMVMEFSRSEFSFPSNFCLAWVIAGSGSTHFGFLVTVEPFQLRQTGANPNFVVYTLPTEVKKHVEAIYRWFGHLIPQET